MLKLPWVDTTKCKRELDCKAAKLCKVGAFKVRAPCADEPGKACGFPYADLELCKRCGECEHACTECAVKMI